MNRYEGILKEIYGRQYDRNAMEYFIQGKSKEDYIQTAYDKTITAKSLRGIAQRIMDNAKPTARPVPEAFRERLGI